MHGRGENASDAASSKGWRFFGDSNSRPFPGGDPRSDAPLESVTALSANNLTRSDELLMSQNYGYPPRLMQAREAARYLGLSESKFRSLGLDRKLSGGNRLYDIRDLDAHADRLDYEGNSSCDSDSDSKNEIAMAFGMATSHAAA